MGVCRQLDQECAVAHLLLDDCQVMVGGEGEGEGRGLVSRRLCRGERRKRRLTRAGSTIGLRTLNYFNVTYMKF